MMDVLKEQIEDCKKLLAKALLNEALEQLASIVISNGFSENYRTEVAKLKTRFASLNTKNRSGLLKADDYLTEENRIGSALFELVKELETHLMDKEFFNSASTLSNSRTNVIIEIPNNAFYKHITKGEKLLEIKHYHESIEEYKKAHELFPEDEFVLKQLIIANIEGYLAKFDSNFKNQAKEYVQKAFDMNPSNQVFVGLYKIVSELKEVAKYRRIFDLPIIDILYFAIGFIFIGLLGIAFQYSAVPDYDPFTDRAGILILSISLIPLALYFIMKGVSEKKKDIILKKLHDVISSK
ncbi:MAG: hypothetical protein SFU99_22090 [Saprospiraceae bacterium]|nr:hypothetical protein [Saprospiraceae bacterium]